MIKLPPELVTALNADPLDSTLRLAVADWVQEQGREGEAEGWRWLVREGRRPNLVHHGWVWYTKNNTLLQHMTFTPTPERATMILAAILPWRTQDVGDFEFGPGIPTHWNDGLIRLPSVAVAEGWAAWVWFYRGGT